MAGEWLLLINTLYNGILLTFSKQITQTPLSKKKTWVMAFISSFIGLILFPSVLGLLISFFILCSSFTSKRLMNAACIAIGSFCAGGMLTAIQAYASEERTEHWLWLLLAILLLLYVLRVWRLRWKVAQQHLFVPCEIKIGDQLIPLNGFIDTGNSCIEPLSAMPVHFVALPAVQHYLPRDMLTGLKDGSISKETASFREVFLTTVNGDKLMYALKVEELFVNQIMNKGHYIVFIEKKPKFGRQVDVILHCSMLPKL